MKLYFNLSKEGQLSEIKNGKETKRNQVATIAIDKLTVREREAVASLCCIVQDELFLKQANGRVSESEISYGRKWATVGEVDSLDIIVELVKTYNARCDKEKQEQDLANERAAKYNRFFKYIESDKPGVTITDRRSEGEARLSYRNRTYATGYLSYDTIIDDLLSDKVCKWISGVDTEEENKRVAEEQREAAKKLESEKLASGRAELLRWSQESGSDLLKLRIKHSKNWEEMAILEWSNSRIADFTLLSKDCLDRLHLDESPGLSALQELDRLSLEHPGSTLAVYKYNDGTTYISCEVKTPLRFIVTLFKKIS